MCSEEVKPESDTAEEGQERVIGGDDMLFIYAESEDAGRPPVPAWSLVASPSTGKATESSGGTNATYLHPRSKIGVVSA